MALGDLADELHTLSLSEPEYLLFNPTGDKLWLREKFDGIPRYLFRVFTPNSDGTTDRFWVKSKDAKYSSADSRVDNQRVASMLNRHLRWRGKDEDPDNWVSWTSSLLFALQYIFYRHIDSRDGSSLDRIYLCVVDTVSFPKGVFLRDMDLIDAYRSFDTNLLDLEGLRRTKHRHFAGSFYFGEYLSQGLSRIILLINYRQTSFGPRLDPNMLNMSPVKDLKAKSQPSPESSSGSEVKALSPR